MRIMEIISCGGINGPVIHCMHLCRELARNGHNVTLLCPPEAWIAGELAAEPIEVIYSDMRRFPPNELRRVAKEIRGRGIEVVHTHMSRAHFFGILLRWFAGVPSVATAHSQHFQLHWMFNDLVIAVSEVTRKYHRRHNGVRSKRIVMIHNFVLPDLLSPQPAAVRESTRASLGAAGGGLLLGIVATVLPNKGHQYLLRALPKISAAASGVRLAIIGAESAPGYSETLRREIEQLGLKERVFWAGLRTDMPAVMAALDICVITSFSETLSMVALEAMAAGVPVVATSVGGIPECVVHEKTGLLVPPNDANALADAVIGLAKDADRRRELGAAGQRHVADNFLAPKQVALIEEALRRVVDGKH
jgi:glycosyltransferase involved in cell wall biosynthesis